MNTKKQIKPKLREYIFDRKISNAEKVLEDLGILTEMDSVLSYDTFILEVLYDLANMTNSASRKNVFIMGDIDNLGTINMKYSKEDVDRCIYEIISDIRKILRNNKISTYHIGKLGDEIYIYSEDQPENTDEIINELNNIVLPISQEGKEPDCVGISFGCIQNINKLSSSIHEVENIMKRKKKAGKKEKSERLSSLSVKEKINMLSREIDNKLRINLEGLSVEDRRIYLKLKKEAIINISLLGSIQNENMRLNEHDEEINIESRESYLCKRIEETAQLYSSKFFRKPISELTTRERNLLKPLCISAILKSNSINGVETMYSFLDKTYMNIFGDDQEKDVGLKKKGAKIISIHIGKIKYYNDTYGHGKCDKQIKAIMESILNKIRTLGLEKDASLIAHNISNYSLLFKKNVPQETIETILMEIKRIEKSIEGELFLIPSQIRTIEKDSMNNVEPGKKYKEIVETIVNEAIEEGRKETEAINTKRKIEDRKLITAAAKAAYTDLFKQQQNLEIELKDSSNESEER